MKSLIFTIVIGLIGFMSVGFAQVDPFKKPKTLYVINHDLSRTLANYIIINSKDIISVNIPAKSEAIKDIGQTDADIIAYVTLKPGIKLLTLPIIFDAFNISPGDRNMPLRIDGLETLHSESILAVKSEIYKINVDKQSNYIEIMTKTMQHIKE